MENEFSENWYQVNLLNSSAEFGQEWSENQNNKIIQFHYIKMNNQEKTENNNNNK